MISRCLGLVVALLAVGCTPPPPPAERPPVAPAPTEARDPAPVTDGDVTVAYENGLRILVKRIPGSELAAMQLYIRGGAQLRTKETAGIEQLALRTAVVGGTRELDKQAFGHKLSALGSDLSTASVHAYSVIAAKSLTESFDETFALMADAFLAPAMPVSEIEIQRERQLAEIRQRDVTPDGRLDLLVIDAMYEGHPYHNLPGGTLESVAALTPEMLVAHLATLRQTSRLELVVVGDVTADHVRELVRAKLGKLPRGDFQRKPLPKPSFAQAQARIVSAELPTHYIEASFVGPSWDDPDFAAGILAMQLLRRHVWEEVRTKRNLSYAPSARYGFRGEITRGSLYVTAVDPNTTMQVMFDQVRALQAAPVGEKELAGAKSVFVTSHLMANESTDGQASWLAICDLIGGDWRLSRSLIERIKAVTPAEIQSFAKRRIGKLQTVVLGPSKDIDEAALESL